jgi:hypothetical protein
MGDGGRGTGDGGRGNGGTGERGMWVRLTEQAWGWREWRGGVAQSVEGYEVRRLQRLPQTTSKQDALLPPDVSSRSSSCLTQHALLRTQLEHDVWLRAKHKGKGRHILFANLTTSHLIKNWNRLFLPCFRPEMSVHGFEKGPKLLRTNYILGLAVLLPQILYQNHDPIWQSKYDRRGRQMPKGSGTPSTVS